MGDYTMAQWSSVVTELDNSYQALRASKDTALSRDLPAVSAWLAVHEGASFWLPSAGADFELGQFMVVNPSADGLHRSMSLQLGSIFDQLDGVWRSEFNGFKTIPKLVFDKSKMWADLTPNLTESARDLYTSTTGQNWIGAGAEAYFETMPKQLAAIQDMGLMAANAANNLSRTAEIMAGVYVYIAAGFEQIANAVDDINDSPFYPRSASLIHWVADFGKSLQRLATGIGERWNVDMYGPIGAMDKYLDANSELKEARTWPTAANLDGDFTPTAPNPHGAPPPTPPPAGPELPDGPVTVTVPTSPLQLDHHEGGSRR